MIKRLCYMAQYEKENINIIKEIINKTKVVLKSVNILTLSLFNSEETLFLYYECINEDVAPTEILGSISLYLKPWPGAKEERLWVPMYDIFHYNKPISIDQWKRKSAAVKPLGMIAKLKPEMISSYIFYHHQYQEEKPGDGDKYGIINLHENLMFFYLEEPFVKEKPQYQGSLSTNNTPRNWVEVMDSHFIYWEDSSLEKEIWKHIEVLLHISENIVGGKLC